jgi:hypothetical protein
MFCLQVWHYAYLRATVASSSQSKKKNKGSKVKEKITMKTQGPQIVYYCLKRYVWLWLPHTHNAFIVGCHLRPIVQ